MRGLHRVVALLIGLAGAAGADRLLAQQAENPLAVQLVNTSIEIFREARQCGWDRNKGDVSADQVLRLSSKLLRGAIDKGQLNLAEAAHAQANRVIPGYVNGYLHAHANDPDSCKTWQAIWTDWSDPANASAPDRQPLSADLTPEDQANYWRMNNTNCTLFELRRLDDGRRDPQVIARSALGICHSSVTAYLKSMDLPADDPATLDVLANGAAARVVRNRASGPR
jgi:type II secretory pathway pseudopilin PulG